MSMMVSFVLSFFPRGVLDEILNLIETVSERFPSCFCNGENVVFRAPKHIINLSLIKIVYKPADFCVFV